MLSNKSGGVGVFLWACSHESWMGMGRGKDGAWYSALFHYVSPLSPPKLGPAQTKESPFR